MGFNIYKDANISTKILVISKKENELQIDIAYLNSMHYKLL